MTNKISNIILDELVQHMVDRLEQNNDTIIKVNFKRNTLSCWFDGAYEIYQSGDESTVFSIFIKQNKVIIGTLFAPELPKYKVFLLNNPNVFDLVYDFVLELITPESFS